MSYVDIIIVLFLLYGAFRGFSKGLVVEVATLAGLVLGVCAAVRYSAYTEGVLRDFTGSSSRYLSSVALGMTFLLVLFAVCLSGRMLTHLVHVISLGLVNKWLGAFLGAAKYFIVVCAVLVLADMWDDKFHFISEETREKSLLFRPFLNFAKNIYHAVRF